ncbi:SUF system NifU family Fe-S cluster assembly protein [Patescibacteria group bacterium]|nr:SUF system NifU family Fe-S cluster assembly protein [Patescibacteria group bacterium]
MNLYREHIMDHYKNPRNRGTLPNADMTIEESNPVCGDKLKLMYKLDGDRVNEVKFEGEGCAISLAAASMLTEMIEGKTLEELKAIRDEDMLKQIGVPLSPTRVKCGLLALSGLRKGLKQDNLAGYGNS